MTPHLNKSHEILLQLIRLINLTKLIQNFLQHYAKPCQSEPYQSSVKKNLLPYYEHLCQQEIYALHRLFLTCAVLLHSFPMLATSGVLLGAKLPAKYVILLFHVLFLCYFSSFFFLNVKLTWKF